MALLFRWLMRIFAGLAVLSVLALALAYYLASRSLPDYDRSYVVEGPEAPLEIVRDRFAVPHILADNDHDAFFGLGFVHAQDRLWQLTMLRRTAQGRLSETFGRETLRIDELMRALDLYGASQTAADALAPETLAALEAYGEGINAWLNIVQDEALGRGAPEFFLFSPEIAPWTPSDSIAIQKLMALQLTDKATMETLRASLSLKLPPERVEDLLPEAPNPPTLALPEYASRFPHASGETTLAAARHPLDPVPGIGRSGASNAFAAAGRRTAGGKPLLATDPHLGLTAPGIFMLARMDLAEGPVMGGTIPGIPAILIGRNDELGWGLTASYLDDQDIFIERLNPENPDEYLTPEGHSRFETRDVVIGIRGEPGETRRMLRTRHGPVVPGNHFGVDAVTPPGHVATLAWTALEPEDRSIGAAIALMRARSVAEARDAVQGFLAPSLNLVLADRDTVGLQVVGKVPARAPQNTSQGRLPAPGWLAQNAWQGFRPYDTNPAAIDPPGGIVVNTNNPIADAPFPEHFSYDWGDAYRIIRGERLLNGRRYHTLDSFIEIQNDAVEETARVLLPLIARDLWYSGEPAAEDTVERRRQVALERLANWTGEMSEHAPEPLIYAAWVRALQRRLAVDELGTLVDLLPPSNPLFLERVYRNVEGAGVWCDVVQTSREERCTTMARLALDEALLELTQAHGPRVESWRWGDAHQAVHRHQTLGSVPLLNVLVNIRQSTPGGDHTLLRGQMPGRGAEPYLNIHASTMRAVYDLSDPNGSVFIAATGQSGHLLSRHYDDMAGLWRRGEYVPMSLDAELARAGAIGVTRIRPDSR
jgi:penicillin G amidase